MSGAISRSYITPDTEPANTICRLFVIRDDDTLRAALDDMLAYLTNPQAWVEIAGVSPEIAASMAAEVLVGMVPCPPTGEGEIMNLPIAMYGDQFEFVGSGTYSMVVNTLQAYAVYWQMASAIGDYIQCDFTCQDGVYDIKMLGIRATSCCRAEVFIDAASIGFVDWGYTGGTVYNVTRELTGISISEGQHTLKIVIYENTHSGLQTRITKVWIMP